MRANAVIAPATTAVLTALIAACASTPTPVAPVVPASLQLPDRVVLLQEVPATGVQIYDCAASKADPLRFEWVFRAPEADLFDTNGRRIGKHYAGPTWESVDGSTVVGEVKGRDDGPDPDAIPWLLLAAKSASGSGAFGRVQSIQRINTVGGKAPEGGCSQATAGKEARVPYKATYYLYVPAP
ncbi:MAG: hypothetical protein JWO70_3493 [Betaproteobacteria bacterium]|jgi:hypothetical protein|nr:hypothetical protein [Betaproteobacteria bacterium]